ncbi:MAG: thiamine diphosphokinase, partial [Planctomycetota bacterium]
MIVNHTSPLTLIGGGAVTDRDMDRATKVGPTLVAADGGAIAAVARGLIPTAVIGDFDSIDETTIAALQEQTLHHFSDQDSTDFDKCLRNIDAPLILGIGFAGARLDHHLANLNT